MKKPEVSIIIPAFNNAGMLSRAVESCLSQTENHIEVIVVDDASTDSTLEVATGLAAEDSRVSIIHHERNRQLLEARRTGVKAAQGASILFLDADDWLDPDVCEASLAKQREATADIVNFPIVPEYAGTPPAAEVVRGRAQMYAAPDLTADGPDGILHATYRDDEITWSLCGKLFTRDLIERAFTLIPHERMFQCEDAYLYFIIASLGEKIASRSGLPSYHYLMGVGGTRADADDLTAEQFDHICGGKLAADRVASFLSEREHGKAFHEDYDALRARLLADPVIRFPHAVAPLERPTAFDALLGRWPAPEAIGSLAALHWNEPTNIVDAVLGAHTLARTTGTVHTVAVYYHVMGTGGAERVTHDLLALWRSMGLEVVLLLDEGGEPPAFRLPDGIACEIVPSCFEATGKRYRERAETLTRVLTSHGVDALVYCQWLSPTLPWDLMLAKALGLSFIIHTHGTFSALLGYGFSDFCELPRIYRLADGIVCLSATDQAFWKNFNARVYLTLNPTPQACLGEPAATLGGHTIVWVGRIAADKDPRAALSVMKGVVERVPDARLIMVGPVDDQTRADMIAEAAHLGIANAVKITGSIGENEMPKVYRQADVFLMTSRYEGWSMALAEAKASGVPCITYDMPYLTLLEGHHGVLVAPLGNEDALAQATAKVLLDPKLAREIGRAGRTHMNELIKFDYARLWKNVFAGAAPEDIPDPNADRSRLMWDTLLSTARLKLEELEHERVHAHELECEIASEKRAIVSLQTELSRAHRDLTDINNSISFKIGHIATWPGRCLRDALGRIPHRP